MLRRQPTQITLTPEDIAAYDDTRAQRAARLNFWENVDPNQANNNASGKPAEGKIDPNDELKPLPVQGGRGRSGADLAREREQRIMGR